MIKEDIIMRYMFVTFLLSAAMGMMAQNIERIPFGDFEQWQTRILHESWPIGGHKKTLYEIAPTKTVDGNIAYTPQGGSPWATSNVYAHVSGITKGSNAVVPVNRPTGGKAAMLKCIMEHCKALGIINIDVVVGGSIFLGQMFEPVTSTKNPYSKMEMGIKFGKRPKALRFDYNLEMPEADTRTYSSGFGKKKTLKGRDKAEVFIILQRRWEDEKGNIYANRVGTGREQFAKATPGWVNNHAIPVHYGDITGESFYKPYMGLISGEKAYYARNSKGKMVPVQEVGWDAPDATPTHLLIMASAASGTAYIGSIGLNFSIDNVGLEY